MTVHTKPVVTEDSTSRVSAPRMVFTFDDIMDMTSAALRSAGVTEIRPLNAVQAARLYPSYSHRDQRLVQ